MYWKFICIALSHAHIISKANSKCNFSPNTPIRRVHKHVPETEEGQTQEEPQGAPDLGHEGGEGVDLIR